MVKYHLMEELKKRLIRTDHPGLKRSLLFFMAFVFMLAIHDGIISYLTPLTISDAGYSNSAVGIVIGLTSLAGAVFDLVICRISRNTFFRRMYLAMFAVGALYIFLMAQAKSLWLFVVCMCLWGLYFDLLNMGHMDYVGRCMDNDHHSSGYGLLYGIKAAGAFLSPIAASYLFEHSPWPLPWVVGFVLMVLAAIPAIYLIRGENASCAPRTQKGKVSLKAQLLVWRRMSLKLAPVLAVMFMLCVFDSVFWSMGPIFSESLTSLNGLKGIFISAYDFPSIIVGWFVGSITLRFGKKKTALSSLLMGALVLGTLGFLHSEILIVLVTFLASFFLSVSWPAIEGAFADYVSESKDSKEVQGLSDFVGNIGYVIGPAVAGYFMDIFGMAQAFSVLSFAIAVGAGTLLFVMPRSIRV